MSNIIYNLKKFKIFFDLKLGPLFIIWFRNTFYTVPIFEVALALSFVFIRITLNTTIELQNYIRYEAIFYDTGTMMSLLICLEHLFVCYYLIIILFMVYWSLYIFLLDFLGWNPKYNGLISFFYNFCINFFYNFCINLYFNLYRLILKLFVALKEIEFIFFLYYTHINFSADSSIPLHILGLFPFHFKKAYLNRRNIFNIFINFFNHLDILGRSILLINYGTLKFLLLLTLLLEYIVLLQQKTNYNTLIIKKKMSNFFFYNSADAYFFSNVKDINTYEKKSHYSKLNYSNWLFNLRVLYKDIFLVNNFKHSGIFEAVWAAFPTTIIICILIPSLILLYSFEDILNPRMTIKVIGNQWYWTYEFDNWVTYTNSNGDENIYTNFAFDSRILRGDDLEFGTKRLLEVDNRLVLPTNVTTRFLISSSDVLHSFAMPELGFKVDATPGRLNQILVYISRPGVYYGQCSELCGAEHGFMPIVIQAVTPKKYLTYLENVFNL